MSEYTIAHTLHNMIAAPASVATVQVIYKTEDGILFGYTTATKAALDAILTDFAPGCLLLDTTNVRWYVNQGTLAAPDFQYLATYTDA